MVIRQVPINSQGMSRISIKDFIRVVWRRLTTSGITAALNFKAAGRGGVSYNDIIHACHSIFEFIASIFRFPQLAGRRIPSITSLHIGGYCFRFRGNSVQKPLRISVREQTLRGIVKIHFHGRAGDIDPEISESSISLGPWNQALRRGFLAAFSIPSHGRKSNVRHAGISYYNRLSLTSNS